jgi:hypothetical protein
MELVGLEPTTSWVRFKSTTTPNQHHERFSGQPSRAEPLGYPALPRGFWGWGARHPQNDRPLPGGRNRADQSRACASRPCLDRAPVWTNSAASERALSSSADVRGSR